MHSLTHHTQMGKTAEKGDKLTSDSDDEDAKGKEGDVDGDVTQGIPSWCAVDSV